MRIVVPISAGPELDELAPIFDAYANAGAPR